MLPCDIAYALRAPWVLRLSLLNSSSVRPSASPPSRHWHPHRPVLDRRRHRCAHRERRLSMFLASRASAEYVAGTFPYAFNDELVQLVDTRFLRCVQSISWHLSAPPVKSGSGTPVVLRCADIPFSDTFGGSYLRRYDGPACLESSLRMSISITSHPTGHIWSADF